MPIKLPLTAAEWRIMTAAISHHTEVDGRRRAPVLSLVARGWLKPTQATAANIFGQPITAYVCAPTAKGRREFKRISRI